MNEWKFLRVLFPAALCLLICCCDQPGGGFIRLCMPEYPNAVPCSWLIEYPSAVDSGIPVYTRELASGDTFISPARGINLPILVRPVFNPAENSPASGEPYTIHGGFPAGAVYPADVSGWSLQAGWEDGFACEILYSCRLNSDAVRGFDTDAFRTAVKSRAAELADESGLPLPGGSWLLDPVPVISRLGYGLFRSSSLTPAETMSFSIPAAPGTWLSDNPLYPPVEVTEISPGAGLLEVSVPINRKTVFFEHESSGLIEVYFSEKLWCWSNLLSGASESGRR